jgi:hypothetical protein
MGGVIMDPLLLALIAAGAVAAVVGIVLLMRRGGPGPPAKTVSQFQESREHLASVESPAEATSDAPDPAARRLVRSLGREDRTWGEDEREEELEDDLLTAPPLVAFDESEQPSADQRPSSEVVMVPSDTRGNAARGPSAPGPDPSESPEEVGPEEEVEEVASLIRSISSESSERTKKGRSSPKRKKHQGPITIGRTTYVLVDEEGRPQLGD